MDKILRGLASKPAAHTDFHSLSLAGFQGLNSKLYLIQNDRGYTTTELVWRVHRHITHMLKMVRKKRHDHIGYNIAMAFSWSLALANRFHIDLDEETWLRFPGKCPYCTQPTCACGTMAERQAERSEVHATGEMSRPSSLHDFQKMFARIYPNGISESASHFAEECGELHEDYQLYRNTHNPKYFNKSVEELVDLVTTVFSIASSLQIDLATEMEKWFKAGCPGCTSDPCKCDFQETPKCPNC